MRTALLRWLRRVATDDDGPTTAEYAIMLALLLGASLLAISGLGLAAQESWQNSLDTITQAVGP